MEICKVYLKGIEYPLIGPFYFIYCDSLDNNKLSEILKNISTDINIINYSRKKQSTFIINFKNKKYKIKEKDYKKLISLLMQLTTIKMEENIFNKKYDRFIKTSISTITLVYLFYLFLNNFDLNLLHIFLILLIFGTAFFTKFISNIIKFLKFNEKFLFVFEKTLNDVISKNFSVAIISNWKLLKYTIKINSIDLKNIEKVKL